MKVKRLIATALAVVCGPAVALAIPTDASTQNQKNESGGLTARIDSPNENNGNAGPNGRVFCTLYDGGRCLPISKSSCDGSDQRLISFVLTSAAIPANSRMYVFATKSDCTFAENIVPSDAPLDSKDLLSNTPLVNGQAFTFPRDFASSTYSTVQGLATAIGACDESRPIQNTRYRLCIGISPANNGVADSALESGDPLVYMTFLVDTVTPDAPTSFTVTGGDGRFRLRVGLANNDEVAKYIVRYREVPEETEEVAEGGCASWADYKERESVRQGSTSDSTEFIIEGVENGRTFEVCAAARDIAGNIGAFSAPQLVTTRNECDFIECYPGEPPTGYCGQVPGSMLAMWGVLAVLGRAVKGRRKAEGGQRRSVIGHRLSAIGYRPSAIGHRLSAIGRRLSTIGYRPSAIVALLVLLLPSLSLAQDTDPPIDPDPFIINEGDRVHQSARPQFGFELRFGPWRPAIGNDAEREAYETVYGNDSSLFKDRPLMKQLEVSWYPWDRFGVGGLFFRIGHWRASGRTRDCPEGAGCEDGGLDGSVRGNEKTSLTVMPLTVGAVFKLDYFKERFYIPLVPYVKGGIDYFLWFNSAAGKTSVASDGSKGRGGTLGVNGSVGLALNLDWIEPGAAMSGRSGSGIADTYLFIEYSMAYSGFRSSGLEMTENYALVGLAIDLL